MNTNSQSISISFDDSLLSVLKPQSKTKYSRTDAFVDIIRRVRASGAMDSSVEVHSSLSLPEAQKSTAENDSNSAAAVSGAAQQSDRSFNEMSDALRTKLQGAEALHQCQGSGVSGHPQTLDDIFRQKSHASMQQQKDCGSVHHQQSHVSVENKPSMPSLIGASTQHASSPQQAAEDNSEATAQALKSSVAQQTASKQCIINYSHLAHDWQWDRATVKSFLENLEQAGVILLENVGKKITLYV